jgi:hypothetical protein
VILTVNDFTNGCGRQASAFLLKNDEPIALRAKLSRGELKELSDYMGQLLEGSATEESKRSMKRPRSISINDCLAKN